jgi:WD40 repeat protein
MTTLHPSKNVADDSNQKALEELARAIEWNWGQFALILARCNSASLQKGLVQTLQELCSVEIRQRVLEQSFKLLYGNLQTELGQNKPQALMIFGLESVSDLDQLLTAANQVREEFRKNFNFPLVLWVTDEVLQKLIRLAPDFYSWGTTVEFAIATEVLIQFIQQTADEVFAKILDVGAGIFLDNVALNLEIGSPLRAEQESAWKELQNRGVKLDLELEASLEFVLGRAIDNSPEQSRQHYERSLALWQQQERSQENSTIGASLEDNLPGKQISLQKNPPSSNPKSKTRPQDEVRGRQNPKSIERQGCLLYYLGLSWYTDAQRHPARYNQAYGRAKDYFQQCIEVFEQHQRPELAAKFINALAEVLKRLQQWDELEAVAKKALALHQSYSNLFRLARAYGFLAEVALHHSAWTEAEQFAQQALQILTSTQAETSTPAPVDQSVNLDWELSYHQGWYLLSLAGAQQGLGKFQAAIKTLETAKVQTKPQYDPQLYIRILEELRNCYFKQGQYLTAFQVKREKRSIEHQYGFWAFVGAARLQPKQQVINPALAPIEQIKTVTQEIAASGRQPDVNRLLERMGRIDHKLTVIYGQSGVGKSSIVEGGLIPALKQKTIATRDVLPVLGRFYTDWIQGSSRNLAEVYQEITGLALSSPLDSTAAILAQLRKNADYYNLLTVLIFDQFEEFFFVCTELAQRRLFYEFLRDCLDIPYVKIILSLREDYLHHLLEWNRLMNLEVINNNILDKNILYYLGNFTPEEAKSVIYSLTEPTQFSLERSLVDQLVQDLAAELGEVRPIELQVVGAQLQAENITTLEAYRQRGPKKELVKRYLEAAIQDCGPENQQIAKLILYLLTDEQDMRPLQTRGELAEGLELEVNKLDKLDLVLKVLVGEGLVFELPELPADHYQLVHDYLVPFIRQGQEPELLSELKLTKEQLKRALYKEQQQRKRAEITEIEALISLSQALLLSHDQLGALVASVKGARKLLETEVPTDLKQRTVDRLREILWGIQECNRLEGHEATVFDVSFSPDGQIIASVAENGIVKLWRRDGTVLATCDPHQEPIFSISFSPNSQMFALAGGDKTVKLWGCDGTLIKTFEGHQGRVFSVSFSPDGKFIASGSEDGTIKLWSVDGTGHKTINRPGPSIYDVTFSPDGKRLACASHDGTIKLWSLEGTWLRTFEGHNAAVLSLSFSPDGHRLASVSSDGTVRLWSFDGKEGKTLQKRNFRIFRVSFSPDGQMLALVSEDKAVRLCNLNGDKIETFRGHNGKVYGVSFSPDGQMLASSSQDKTVRLWSLDGIGVHTAQGHSGRVLGVSLSPDGQMFASASEDKTLKLWRLDGRLLKTFQGHNAGVRSVSFSPDGQKLASASADATVKLWRLDGTLLKTIQGHNGSVRSVNFSPDGRMLASASNDISIKLWHLDGTLVTTLKGHSASILSVSFSRQGQILASASEDKTVKLWKLDGTLLKTLQGHSLRILSVSFSPDGQILASASADKTVKLWSLDGSLAKTLKGHEASVRGVSFSPDGQTIASVSADRTLKLWSHDGNLIKTLRGHLTGVCHVSFSGDGQLLFSVDEYSTAKLWNLDGTELRTFTGPVNNTRLMEDFSLVSTSATPASGNTTSDLESLLEQACNWLGDYLKTNINVKECDRTLCDDIPTQK